MSNEETGCMGCTLHLQYMELIGNDKIPKQQLEIYQEKMNLILNNVDLSLIKRGRLFDECMGIYDKYCLSWLDKHPILSQLILLSGAIIIVTLFITGTIKIG